MNLASHVLALGALVAACRADSLGPQQSPVRLEGAIGRPSIGVGDTTPVTFRLRNLSWHAVTVTFSTSCQIIPYITDRQTDHIVYPGANVVCLTMIASLTLAPGAEKVISVLVRGGAPDQVNAPGVPLSPGEYVAYARLARSNLDVDLRSDPVPFTVR